LQAIGTPIRERLGMVGNVSIVSSVGPEVSGVALLAGNRRASLLDRAPEQFSVLEWLISIVTKKPKMTSKSECLKAIRYLYG
jgi:hypothetical protein